MNIGNKIVLLDGAMGTELQKIGYNEYPPELNLTHSEVIQKISSQYAEAGSDIITTNTFGVNRFKLEDFNLLKNQEEIIKSAISIALKACEGKDCKIAFDMGPTGEMMEPYGELSFDEAYKVYKECADIIKNEKIDFVLLETFSQLTELKAALLAFKENTDFPVICSMTFEENGRTLTGVSPEAFALTMEGAGAYGIGVNCSTGPDKLLKIVDTLSQYSTIPVMAKPNAGMPVVTGDKVEYNYSSADFAKAMKELVANGATMIGGCCGTTAEHIKALNAEIDELNNIYETKIGQERVIINNRCVCSQRKACLTEEAIASLSDDLKDISHMTIEYAEELVGELELTADLLGIKLNALSFDKEVLTRVLRLYSGIPLIKIYNAENASKELLEELYDIIDKYGAVIIKL